MARRQVLSVSQDTDRKNNNGGDGFCTSVIFNKAININSVYVLMAGRPGSSEVPRNPLARWDVSSIPANGIFLSKKLKNKNKNAQRVEND